MISKLRKKEKEKFNSQDIAVLPQTLDTPVIYQDSKLEAPQDQNPTDSTQDQKPTDPSPDQNPADITESQIPPYTRQNQNSSDEKKERDLPAKTQNSPATEPTLSQKHLAGEEKPGSEKIEKLGSPVISKDFIPEQKMGLQDENMEDGYSEDLIRVLKHICIENSTFLRTG